MLLAMYLMCGTALADGSALSRAVEDYWSGGDEVQFHLSAKIESLTPYGEGTIEMMNALLEHLSVAACLRDGGADAEVTFCVAGDPIVGLTEKQADSGTMLTTSLLPNRVLLSSESAMDGLSGFEQEDAKFDFFAAIEEAESCYRELTDAIIPFAEEKAASYSIKSVGSSRWSRIARLTVEQSAQIQPLIAKVLGCGMDEDFREQLNQMVCQKSFIVGLYQTKEGGDDLAVYIKGNVTFPDGAQRAISYQWAFATNDKGQRVDTYKFEMSKNKAPRDDRTINASIKRIAKEDQLLLDGQSKAVIRDPETGVTTTTTLIYDLNGKNGTLEGSVSSAVRTAKGEEASTTTSTFTPALAMTKADGLAVIKGSVHVEETTGKNTHISMDLLFDEEPADELIRAQETGLLFVVVDDRLPQSSLTQNINLGPEEPDDYLVGNPPIGYTDYPAPQEETVIDLDSISAQERAALVDEMTQRLAGELLRSAARLPDSATALLRDNMSEADYAAFLDLLNE